MAEFDSYMPGTTIQSSPDRGGTPSYFERMGDEIEAQKAQLETDYGITSSLSPEQYNLAVRIMSASKNPEQDMYRISAASSLSRIYNVPFSTAYSNVEPMTKALLGREYKPDATTAGSIQNSWTLGLLARERRELAKDFMDITMKRGDASHVVERMQALDQQMASLQDDVPRFILTDILKMTTENLVYNAEFTAASLLGGAAGGLISRLLGIGGAMGTSFAAKAASKVPALLGFGFTAGMMGPGFQGEQFYDLVQDGVDPDTAYGVTKVSSGLQVAIENLLGIPGSFVGKGFNATKFVNRFMGKLWASGKLSGKLLQFGAAAGLDTVGEGLEEVFGLATEDITNAVAYALSDMDVPKENWSSFSDYVEAFLGGMGGTVLLAGAGAAVNLRMDTRKANILRGLAQSGMSEEQFRTTAKALDLVPEKYEMAYDQKTDTSHMETFEATEQETNDFYHEVYEMNAEARDSSVFNREGIRTRVQETSEEAVNQEDAKPTPTIDDEPVRLPNGMYRMNAEEGAGEHVPSGGTRLTTTVTDPEGKLTYADITYIRRGNNIDIQGIDITEGEHLQADGFRDDILRQFASMYPDYNVTFSNPRFSAESESISRVIASNLRGQQYGLNFGLDFSEEDRAGVAERIKLFSFGEEQKSAAVRLIQMLGAAEGKTGVEFFDSRFQGTISEEDFARLFPEEYAKAQAGGGMNAAYIPSSRVPESLRSASDMGNSVRGILVAGRSANPASFEHEVIHALMQDREKQDGFSDIFAKEMNGQEAFWDFVHKSDLYRDSSVRENFDYIEAHPELFQKGAKWGARQHEFVARLEEMYRLSGQSTRPELRGFFQRLTDFFRRIYRAMKQEGALSDEIVSYFDSFFGTPEDLQAGRQSADGSASQMSVDEILRQEPISAAEFDEFRRRLLSDPSNFDADGNPLAPNGNVSNLTLEQWITVRTPEFKAWFGDWELDPENASMAIDENGEPQVFYHGSWSDSIRVFERQPDDGYNISGSRGGFSFTNSLEAAESYAKAVPKIGTLMTRWGDAVTALFEEYGLYDEDSQFYSLLSDSQYSYIEDPDYLPTLKKAFIEEYFDETYRQFTDDIPSIIESGMPELAEALRATKDIIGNLEDYYTADGPVMTNPRVYPVFLNVPQGTRILEIEDRMIGKHLDTSFDVGSQPTGAYIIEMPDRERVVYVARSNMIKSADGNSGAFSAEAEDIYFQTPSEQQADAKAKLERLLSASDEEILREIGQGREFVFNTDIEEALTDIRSIMNVSRDYDEFIGFMEAVRDNSSLDAAARRRLRRALRKRLAGERTEVTVPPEAILNDTGDYIDTYQMLKAEQEGSEGESLAAPVSNDIPGVLGADERDKAITGDGDESGEIEDAALRRAMETGEEKIEDGEAERVIAETEENLRELRTEQNELDNQLTEIADDIRIIAPENGAKLWKNRRDIQKAEAELRKLERQIERRSRNTAAAAKARYGIEQRTADDGQYRTLSEQLDRLIQQERQISTLARREAERNGKRTQYDRDKARFDAALQKLKDNYSERIKNMRERQQALRVQKYKETLVSRITRRISANTAVEQADMIRAIQALMTEDDRQTVIIRGERWSVELLREMFRDTPNDPMFSALSPQNLEILTKKRPSDFTVSELENILDAVNQLRREGLRAWQAVVDARAAEDRAIIRAMVDTVSKNRHYTNPPAPGSDDEAAADTGFRRRFWDAVYNVINLPRIAQLLDNGASDGPFQRMLVRRNREYENAQARAISQRIGVLTKALQELGIKPSDLFKSYDIVIDAGAGLHGPYSLSQLVYVHYAMNNAKNYQALAYGTLVTSEEKDAIQGQVRKDKPGDPDEKLKTSQLVQGRHTREEEWRAEANERIRKLGDRRYEEFRRQADAILAENPKVMSAAEAVLGDMNGDGFERVQRIMLEQFNRRISKEDFYMPIRRMDWTEVKYDRADADSIRASQLAEEALRGVPRFRPGSVERGFTEERQEISPLQQKPINFDFFQIWQDSVRDEEHLVASMAYVRSLKRVFGDPILQRAITRTHGKEAMGLINEFIQNTAEPWNHIRRDGISNAVRFFRGGLYTSYLGFRASNIIMQAVTSPMPFLSAGVTPAAYMRQLFRFLSDYDQTWQMISELSPMMAERSFDELPALLSEERRAIREQRGSEAEQRIRQSLDKLQEMSLWGLDRVDRVAVGAGWLAIYEREMQRNGGISSEAVRVADDAVLATQPVQRKSEMSRLFRSDNEFARLLTQFTSSLNVVFQNIFFDIPMAYRNRQWGKFWGTIAAYALSGALLFLIREEPWKDSDDDGEEEFQWRQLIYSFFSQAVDSVPLISDSVSQMVYEPITGESAFTFFGSEFPPLERLARVPGNITEGEWQKALRNSLESIGLFSGIPILASEDYWDALVSITQGKAPESIWR